MVKRILILDDDYSNAEALAMIVEQEGFSVKHIQAPDMLFPSLKSFDPQLLFLDIQLGDKDGRLICNEIKCNASTSQLPVVLISAMLPEHIKKVVSTEDGIINKPFNIDEIIDIIKLLI